MSLANANILLLDDDKIDVMAIKRSFMALNITNPVVEAQNGIEAFEHLRGLNGRTKIALPCLILLDLNMPRMGGIEFLGELRRDPELRRILVFITTTSDAARDRNLAYDFNVAGYILKHRANDSFHASMATLANYWEMIEFPD